SASADRRGERKYQGAAGPHRPEARRCTACVSVSELRAQHYIAALARHSPRPEGRSFTPSFILKPPG
ncbi:hypothetical protein BL106_00004025, partial [Klebsiella pneumoniae]